VKQATSSASLDPLFTETVEAYVPPEDCGVVRLKLLRLRGGLWHVRQTLMVETLATTPGIERFILAEVDRLDRHIAALTQCIGQVDKTRYAAFRASEVA
jgi:hypothetical protein